MPPKFIQRAFFASMTDPQAFRLMFDQHPTQATDLHPPAKKIVALLPDHETLTLSQIVTLTQGKPSTVKLRLKELVEKGYLVPKGQGRGAHYYRSQASQRFGATGYRLCPAASLIQIASMKASSGQHGEGSQ